MSMSKTLLGNVHSKDNMGVFPLHQAALHGKTKNAALLIKNGADVYATDKLGRTALYYASIPITHSMTKKASKKVLVNIEFDISSDHFPHIVLPDKRSLQLASLLIKHGADVYAKAKDGSTPISIAKKNGPQKISTIIKKRKIRF